jgi:hypothetical protein
MLPPELRDRRMGSHISPDLAQALEHAITAGACRRAAALNLEGEMQWRALAEAQRRMALARLRLWAVSWARSGKRSHD